LVKRVVYFNMMKNTYKVVKSPLQPRGWAILNTKTNEIVEGGFFSRELAEEWKDLWYSGEYSIMEYIYYRPRRGFTHRLVLLVRKLTG
jgi:hypothetical protein